jgi:hypothetical protein
VRKSLIRTMKRLAAVGLLASGAALSAQSLGTPTTLEYGEMVLGAGGGSITTDPATGAITSMSGVYPTSAMATASSAILATGTAKRPFTIFTTLAGNITMTSGGGASFSTSPGPINSENGPTNNFTFPGNSGTTSLTFHLAGTITIPAGQAAGDYTGTLPIFIQYTSGAQTNSNTVNVIIHIRLISPLSLTNSTDLDMGLVIPGATAGTVTLNPATGAQGKTGGIIFASATGTPAQFGVSGQPSHAIAISFGSTNITLTGPSGTMTLALTSSPAGSATLNASGVATLNVGGTLNVAANQSDGNYSGTMAVTVAYP